MLFALAQWMLTINLDEQIDTQKANHLLKVTQLVSDFKPLFTAPILVLRTRRKGTFVPSQGLLSKLELKFGKPDCYRYAEILVPVPSGLLKSQPTPGPAPSVCFKNKICVSVVTVLLLCTFFFCTFYFLIFLIKFIYFN